MFRIHSKNLLCHVASLLILIYSGLLGQNGHLSRVKLDHIEITGNQAFGENEIKGWFKFRPGDRITESDARHGGLEILKHYKQHGYYFAKLDSMTFGYSADSSNVSIKLHVNEGDPLKLNVLNIEGVGDDEAFILEELETQTGKTFNQSALENDIIYIIKEYEKRGYPYCRVDIAEVRLLPPQSGDDAGLAVTLQVTPGPKVSIGKIEVVGNAQTKDVVILREIGIQRGDVYDQRKVEKIPTRLMKLGYFNWVNPARLEMQKDNTARLIIELQEGSNNRMDGVIGYNPATANSNGFVSGILDLGFGNLFGTGRHIEAHWEKRTQKTQELRFRYLEPYVVGLPLHAGFSFEQLIQDTSFVQRNLGVDFRVLFNENLSFFSKFSKRDITPDSLGAILYSIPGSNSINAAVGFTFDTRDDLLNPRKGLRYETAFEFGKKTLQQTAEPQISGHPDAFEQKRVSVDFESYLPLFKWHVLALGLHGRQITSDEPIIPLTDQYRFGGARTLRGYREEQFRGSRIAWANWEYRYLLGRRSRLFAFLDTGYFFREEAAPINSGKTRLTVKDAKIAYGIGFRVDTKLGFFSIDYGLGEGDSLSNGKVHVGLINEF